MVTVICVTYNQKKYIKDALNGFVMQKTNFDFKVIVADDCSTDGTSEIVSNYAKRYPGIIEHIRNEKNIGALSNFFSIFNKIETKYVAFCDGDDFWIDENKLQKQFEFMEENEDVTILTHKVKVICSKNSPYYEFYKKNAYFPRNNNVNKKLGFKDLMLDFCQTSGTFIRYNKPSINFSNINKEIIGADSLLYCLQINNGYYYIMPECMSVYRKEDSGISAGISRNMQFSLLETRKLFFATLDFVKKYIFDNNKLMQDAVNARYKLEVKNYVNALIELNKWEYLEKLQDYPYAYAQAKLYLLQNYPGFSIKNREKYIKLLGFPIVYKKGNDFCNKTYFLKIPVYSKQIKSNFTISRDLFRIISTKKSQNKKTVKILGITVYKKENLSNLKKGNILEINKNKKFSTDVSQALLNDIKNKINYEHANIKTWIQANTLHPKIFSCCRNLFYGKEVVCCGCGPTVQHYTPIPNAIHIGVNRAYKNNSIDFNYLFAQDKFIEGAQDFLNYRENTCKKFLGIQGEQRLKNIEHLGIYRLPPENFTYKNVYPYILSEKKYEQWAFDITIQPFSDYYGTIFSVLQFVCFANPKRIFLVGFDMSKDHFYKDNNIQKGNPYNGQLAGWPKFKDILERYYSNIEVITINPVGLKGIFKDVYTDEYLEKYIKISSYGKEEPRRLKEVL